MKKLIFLLLIPFSAFAQQAVYPKNYFHAPVDVALDLSGNFGELRPNHFHTGIDITTHGVEGVAVKAAADGYVSRIKISPWGYGRAIYVTHPNGFTTVYGHLSAYNSAIDAYVKTNQYAISSFEIELMLQPGQFPVKQGEVIAYSGNTGSSGGPHLHFEIRDTKTEDALNPLLFGLPIKDNVAPTVVTLVVIPVESWSTVNGAHTLKKIPLKQSGNSYVFVNASDSIYTFGKVGFALETYDKESNPAGKNGVFGIKLQCDKKTIYAHELDRIPFDKSRYINCFINYEENEKHNHFYQQSFLLPNNQLPVYDSLINRGYCDFKSDSIHKLKYFVSDAYGNTTTVSFKVHSVSKTKDADLTKIWVPFIQVLHWDTANLIEESAFRFETPAGAFYQNEIFTFSVDAIKGKAFSPKINFNSNIAVQNSCTLTVYGNVPDSLQKKAFLASVNKNGSRSYLGGRWSGKGVTAEIKEFGSFTIAIDTTAPNVTPSNFDLKGAKQESLSALSSLRFTISDNLAGIMTYDATIDGKWVLMQYEPKKKLIWYTFDEHCEKGKHELVLKVTDKIGNETVYRKNFSR